MPKPMTMITLIRHGRPECAQRPSISRSEFQGWLASYAVSGIKDVAGDAECREFVDRASVVLCSSLPRAVQSAEALGAKDLTIDAVFEEASISVPALPIRASTVTWATLGRLHWCLGGDSEESLLLCRRRVNEAANRLTEAATMGNTLLVGHGWLNGMIARELARRGFAKTGRTGFGYWSRVSMICPDC